MKFHNLETGTYAVVNESATGIKPRIGSLALVYDYLTSPNYDYVIQFQDKNTTKVKESELNIIDENDPIIKIKLGDYVIKKNGQSGKVVKIDYLHKQVEIEYALDEGFEVISSKDLTLDSSEVGKEVDNVDKFETKFKKGDAVKLKTNDNFNNLNGIIERIFDHIGDKRHKYAVIIEGVKNTYCFTEDEMILIDKNELNEGQQDEEEIGYFEKMGTEIGKLVDKKQLAYGDSVSKTFEVIKVLLQDYKNADNTYTIPESLLKIILLEVRKLDKTNRRFSNPDGDLMEENSFLDDVGYSMLGARMVERSE